MPRNVSPLDSLTPEQVAEFDAMRRAGADVRDVADAITAAGVKTNRASVGAWLKRRGVVPAVQAVDITPAADLQTAKLHALEADNRKLLRANTAMREAADRDAVLADVIRRSAEDSFAATVPPAPRARKAGKLTPQEFLAHISDAHYGEVVNPELTNGIAYNPETAIARIDYLAGKIERYAELRPYDISVLHLAILGDMLSGDNHEDLDVTNASVMADQTFEMGRALYDMIVRLRQSGQFGEVRVYIVRGNHPRAHKIPRHKQPHANYEYLMGRHVAEMVRLTQGLDNVSVEVPRSSRLVVDVAGRRVCLTHGDGVKAASFAGIPWYAMKSKRDALQAMHRALGISQVDQISMGHFHQHVHWPSDCNIVVNGSIKGGDEYVQDTRYAHTPPMQIVQDWHPRKGLASTNYIDLEAVTA